MLVAMYTPSQNDRKREESIESHPRCLSVGTLANSPIINVPMIEAIMVAKKQPEKASLFLKEWTD